MEQILYLKFILQHLGVPIRNISCILSINKSAVDNSITLHGKLHKRHAALSFHRAREAIAAKFITCFHIKGKHNPVDILKHNWSHNDVSDTLKSVLF